MAKTSSVFVKDCPRGVHTRWSWRQGISLKALAQLATWNRRRRRGSSPEIWKGKSATGCPGHFPTELIVVLLFLLSTNRFHNVGRTSTFWGFGRRCPKVPIVALLTDYQQRAYALDDDVTVPRVSKDGLVEMSRVPTCVTRGVATLKGCRQLRISAVWPIPNAAGQQSLATLI